MTAKTCGLFVYGTLRPGEGLSSLTYDVATKDGQPRAAYLQGYRLAWAAWHSYPYMIRTDRATDWVRGTWLLADVDRPSFRSILEIELGAGYELEDVEPISGVVSNIRYGRSVAFVLSAEDATKYGALPMHQLWDSGVKHYVYDFSRAYKAWMDSTTKVPTAEEEVESFPRLTMDTNT